MRLPKRSRFLERGPSGGFLPPWHRVKYPLPGDCPGRYRLLILLLWFLVLGLVSGFAQGRRFDHLTRSDGLINASVSSIIQDEQGFLWFGTKGGLARYDGYGFVTYQNDPFDENSLSHNLVQTLFQDSGNILWIGTYRGLNRLDLITHRFTRFVHDPNKANSLSNDVVTSVYRDRSGRLWVGTLDGLNVLDEKRGTFTHYLSDDRYSGALPNNTVRSIVQTKDGTLWIGTYGGLARYNSVSDSFSTYKNDPKNPKSLPSNLILAVKEDSQGFLWVACWNGGLYRFNPYEGTGQTYSFPDNRLYSLEVGFSDTIYAGSWGGGLYELNRTDGTYRQYRADPDDPLGLTNDIIYSLFKDSSGLLWIGTNGGALNKLDRNRESFTLYSHNPKKNGTLGSGMVNAVLEDPRGTLWVGTYNGGLSRLDPGSQEFIHYRYKPQDPASLSNDIVNGIAVDADGLVWVATNEGLNRLDPRTGKFKRFLGGEGTAGPLADITVYALSIDSHGRHWYGYFRKGLERYDPSTGERKRYRFDASDPHSLSDNMVYCFFEDSHGTMWVGTNRGLNRYDPHFDGFIRYLHDPKDPGTLPSDTIRAIMEDSRGRLWVGTASGGLSRFDPATDRWVNLFKKDGLSDDSVLAIQEDSQGRLWLGTSYGLNIYNSDTNGFYHPSMMDGLQGMEFSQASFKSPSGFLYFGGTEGLNKIASAQIKRNTHIPPIKLTALKIMDTPYDQGNTDPAYVETITVLHNENFISFEFSALDFSDPKANQYKYRLEGFDKDWIQAGNRHYVSYTNLPGGRYVFRVQGSNNEGRWNTAGLSLALVVGPAFWVTPAAFLLYAVTIALVMGLVALWSAQNQRLHLSQAQLAEQLRLEKELKASKDRAEAADRAKTQFLATVSHEIRTPLNAILGYTHLLFQALRGDPRQNWVGIIDRNARSLLGLLNDVLELSRIEAGKEYVQKGPINLRMVIEDLVALFQVSLQNRSLYLHTLIDPSADQTIVSDERMLRQILINLLGNAVKFTQRGGITLEALLRNRPKNDSSAGGVAPVDESVDDLEIRISDTGIGIDPENLPLIFDRFYQSPGSALKPGGTGLGLSIVQRLVELLGGTIRVESEIGKGTAFTVRLPVSVLERPPDGLTNFTAESIGGRGEGKALDVNQSELNQSELNQSGSGLPGGDLSGGPVRGLGNQPPTLTGSALRRELGAADLATLMNRLRQELLPLLEALPPVFFLAPWKALGDRSRAVSEAWPSAVSLKTWTDHLEEALENLDYPGLQALAQELSALLGRPGPSD